MINSIGIMGGTFNPIHNGHIYIAEKAHEILGIDKILFMPSKIPPHKLNQNIIPEIHRCNMVKLAIKDYDFFEFSDLELSREGITYSSDTLQILREKYDEVFFIIGADSLRDIEKWHEPALVMKLAHLVVAPRSDAMEQFALEKYGDELKARYNAKITFLHFDSMNISSSEIRANLSKNKAIGGLLPASVLKYIKEEKLYGWGINFINKKKTQRYLIKA